MTQRPFLTAQWRHLAMINYEVEPSVLRPLVPRGTELDVWNGRTYVSVVGFLFLDTRLLGLPVPFHKNFEEVNLRFYVRHKGSEGWRRGVSFVKEVVPKWAIAVVARFVYNEPYEAMRMRHALDLEAGSARAGVPAEYAWLHRSRWNRLRVTPVGVPEPMRAGSEEEFIAEHYWGYTGQRDGGTVEYRVEHPPWRVRSATDVEFDCDVAALYGRQFQESLGANPTSAFLAEGSSVAVNRPVWL